MFRNSLHKLKNKDSWNVYSGDFNVGLLKKEKDLHYLHLDERVTFSIEELSAILKECYTKINKPFEDNDTNYAKGFKHGYKEAKKEMGIQLKKLKWDVEVD